MNRWRRPRGFTLIELIVVIAVVAILVGVGLNRLTGYQEAAEAAAAESNLSNLRSALHIRSAELIGKNRWDELARLAAQNPFDLLERPPANYGGALAEEAAGGYWYYDRRDGSVVYKVLRGEAFRAADGRPEMRFAVVGRNTAGQAVSGGGVAYVTLQARGDYRWLDRPIR